MASSNISMCGVARFSRTIAGRVEDSLKSNSVWCVGNLFDGLIFRDRARMAEVSFLIMLPTTIESMVGHLLGDQFVMFGVFQCIFLWCPRTPWRWIPQTPATFHEKIPDPPQRRNHVHHGAHLPLQHDDHVRGKSLDPRAGWRDMDLASARG